MAARHHNVRKLGQAAGLLWLPMILTPCGASAKPNLDVITSFTGGASGNKDGANPSGALGYANGAIYGTTYFGGPRNAGTVFAITPAGQEVFVTDLNNATGRQPSFGIQQGGELFYGAGVKGGSRNCPKGGCGRLFSADAAGKVKAVYSFQGGGGGETPGSAPLDIGGTLYGVTIYGGTYGSGLLYALSPSGVFTVLHSFGSAGDGKGPIGLINVGGVFYGFTAYGGANNDGAAYSVTMDGTETVLYSFGATGTDAIEPAAPAVYANGVLYGTSDEGGTNSCPAGSGCGTIFTVSRTGAETVLYSFQSQYNANNAPGPLEPLGNLLYGTGPDGQHGCGFIFSVSAQGVVTDIYDFAKDKSEGCGPGGPLMNESGVLYGVMGGGGANNAGTLYGLTP